MICPDCKCAMIVFTDDFVPTIYQCPKCGTEIEEDDTDPDEDGSQDPFDDIKGDI